AGGPPPDISTQGCPCPHKVRLRPSTSPSPTSRAGRPLRRVGKIDSTSANSRAPAAPLRPWVRVGFRAIQRPASTPSPFPTRPPPTAPIRAPHDPSSQYHRWLRHRRASHAPARSRCLRVVGAEIGARPDQAHTQAPRSPARLPTHEGRGGG